MNWATVIVLLVVLALVAFAVYFLRKGKSSCCDNKKNSCSGCSVDCPFRR